MKNIFISLGSNIGDREAHLGDAIQEIKKTGITIEKSSSVYESEAWGYSAQPSFLNQVLQVSTELSPEDLLHELKEIEQKGGRKQRKKWHEREIDLDILYYGRTIMNTSNLQIPHRCVRERNFVLVPLAEIAGDFFDPEVNETIQEVLSKCDDEGTVKKHNLKN